MSNAYIPISEINEFLYNNVRKQQKTKRKKKKTLLDIKFVMHHEFSSVQTIKPS